MAFIGIGVLWTYLSWDEVPATEGSSELAPLRLVDSLEGARLGQTLAELATHPFDTGPWRPTSGPATRSNTARGTSS